MEHVAKEVLNHLENTHTKVERKSGFVGNYYSPLIDTIYIAENYESTKIPKAAKNLNKNASELIVICHECVHSAQNKLLHILNTIFANISMLVAVICIFLSLLGTSPVWFESMVIAILGISMVIRLILEIGAINGSTKLAREMVETTKIENVSQNDIEEGIQYINKHKLLALMQMVSDKILFLVLVIVI